jgi:hypothetical protein
MWPLRRCIHAAPNIIIVVIVTLQQPCMKWHQINLNFIRKELLEMATNPVTSTRVLFGNQARHRFSVLEVADLELLATLLVLSWLKDERANLKALL